jgi:membrane-associated phospholipid phosphatase
VRTTLLAGALLGNVRWLMAFVILAMMAALVYLGDHWMSDVLGGLTLGWAVVEARDLLTKARSRSYPRG